MNIWIIPGFEHNLNTIIKEPGCYYFYFIVYKNNLYNCNLGLVCNNDIVKVKYDISGKYKHRILHPQKLQLSIHYNKLESKNNVVDPIIYYDMDKKYIELSGMDNAEIIKLRNIL